MSASAGQMVAASADAEVKLTTTKIIANFFIIFLVFIISSFL